MCMMFIAANCSYATFTNSSKHFEPPKKGITICKMNTIGNIVNFPKILFRISNALVRQKVFVKKHIDPILVNYLTSDLTASDISKIKKYYGLAVPAILGNGFSILRGTPLTQSENYALTYLGSLSGIYDDLFDKLNTKKTTF